MTVHFRADNDCQTGIVDAPRRVASAAASEPRLDAPHASPGIDFVETLDAESLDEVGARLALSTADAAGCRALVAIRSPEAKRFQLIGDSRGLEKPRKLSLGDPLEQALTESWIIATADCGPCRESTVELTTPLRTELAHRAGVAHAHVCLLADRGGQVQGALVLLRDTPWPNGSLQRCFGGQMTDLASYLRLRREAAATWREMVRSTAGRAMRAKRTHVLLAATVVASALLLTPVPHRIGANCQCEPATRRVVTAPFDSQLAESLVKPGDRVSAGQILATFEGTEIIREIESLTAEQKQARQRYDAAIAGGEASIASTSALELQRIAGRLRLLRQQRSRLQLRSPSDGILVSGDLEEAVGSTVAVGERLLEVAPLDRMKAEIAIDESDIGFVSAGQRVVLEFDGRVTSRCQATLERIFPRAEMIDGKNVYIAEAELEGDLDGLAPGMRGRAKVYADWQPLGSTLFRKPYLALRRLWGWY